LNASGTNPQLHACLFARRAQWTDTPPGEGSGRGIMIDWATARVSIVGSVEDGSELGADPLSSALRNSCSNVGVLAWTGAQRSGLSEFTHQNTLAILDLEDQVRHHGDRDSVGPG